MNNCNDFFVLSKFHSEEEDKKIEVLDTSGIMKP
jgi:hypothetical protein